MSPPQENVQDQRPFPLREGHARPVEVTARQSRGCGGRDVRLGVNGGH